MQFVDAEGRESGEDTGEESSSSYSQLKRQKTPLPRDLKTKSGFLSRFHGQKRGSIDGSVIPHNPKLENREQFRFRPARDSPSPPGESGDIPPRPGSRSPADVQMISKLVASDEPGTRVDVEVTHKRVCTKTTTITTTQNEYGGEDEIGEIDQREVCFYFFFYQT